MRTTVIIDDEKIGQLMSLTGSRKKSEAINNAIDHFLHCLAKQRLLDLKGTLVIKDDWLQTRELEQAEK